jgi:hypothetical protein
MESDESDEWLRHLRSVVEQLRAEYEARGRRADFERQVEHFRGAGVWPFDD